MEHYYILVRYLVFCSPFVKFRRHQYCVFQSTSCISSLVCRIHERHLRRIDMNFTHPFVNAEYVSFHSNMHAACFMALPRIVSKNLTIYRNIVR
jgi:hypothetical protein